MLKSIIFGLLLSLSLLTFAQVDSVEVTTMQAEYDFIYKELFNFSQNSTFGPLQLDQPIPALSQFRLYNPIIIDFNIFDSNTGFRISNNLPVFSPFINSFSITNQAHYRLNDKLTLGGNSFSANSIYNPLPLNPSIQDMGIRGASMFLQYKISDKFKVGGSFSISNQRSPFLP